MDINEVRERIFNGVLDHGHIVQPIDAGPTWGPAYAYTVGRTLKQRPELLVSGLPVTLAGLALNTLALADDHGDLHAGRQIVTSEGTFDIIEANPEPCATAVITMGEITVWQAVHHEDCEQRIFHLREFGPDTDPYGV